MKRWRRLIVVIAGLVPVVAMGASAAEQASTAGAKASKGAVKLVTPRGKALSGPWQRYADRALVPTVHGRVRVRVQRCPARPASAGCRMASFIAISPPSECPTMAAPVNFSRVR